MNDGKPVVEMCDYDGMLCLRSSEATRGLFTMTVRLYDGRTAHLDFLNLIVPRGLYAFAGMRLEEPKAEARQDA